MKSMTFLNHKRPLLTAMVQADNPERILELSSRAAEGEAEAAAEALENNAEEAENETENEGDGE